MSLAKRQRTGGSPTPLALFKAAGRRARSQAAALCSGRIADTAEGDAAIAASLAQAIAQLEAGSSSAQQPPLCHSLDLELDDPEDARFLLASCHLALGRLRQRQDSLEDAAACYERALRAFPACVAAHAALGSVLRSAAACEQQLARAERHLSRAVAIAADLAGAEAAGGLLVEANPACAAELEAADEARAQLAMLLCQAGRSGEAAPQLAALGFKYRLAGQVLHYALPSAQADAGAPGGSCSESSGASAAQDDAESAPFLRVLDGALPPRLLSHLQAVFAPGAPFWPAHSYGRVGYISHFFRLDEAADAPSSSMHQVAAYLQRLAISHFPQVAVARFAEVWAHCRRHASGHQLHYDSDNEGQGGARHPLITAIVHLSANAGTGEQQGSSSGCEQRAQQQALIGGPTLMTDQRLGGRLASRGWLAFPAASRVVLFDGRWLHGVVPGRGPSPAPEGRRVTLMVAFWDQLQERTPPGAGVGACMQLPRVDSEDCPAWACGLAPLAELGEEPAPRLVCPGPALPAVWEALDGGPCEATGASYSACFQGF